MRLKLWLDQVYSCCRSKSSCRPGLEVRKERHVADSCAGVSEVLASRHIAVAVAARTVAANRDSPEAGDPWDCEGHTQ